MTPGTIGSTAVFVGLSASLLVIIAYTVALWLRSSETLWRSIARAFYALTCVSVLTAFGALAYIVYHRLYQYDYAVQHTGNDLHNHWFRLAATWSGQEGSFLLWACWTAIIGCVVMLRARRYEARVMPIYTSVIAFLCAILIKQSPYTLFLKAHPGMPGVPPDGFGLTPSLQNYWMTIHPPTIFFGFASLAVPFSYAAAALIWRDYEGWAPRVFPYALLSSAVLGLGLFMGGYWAYETLGWHGFWAWDPVENASFFPWLAVTALAHGLLAQRTRRTMVRTNLFLGLLAFWLFLVGTFLTRSGALASKMPNGQLLSVHAFDNIGKSGLVLMVTMLLFYGIGGLALWLWRLRTMPKRPSMGDSLLSRDFALMLSVLLMGIACAIVTLGSTTPLFLSWLHRPPSAPAPVFYNKAMFPVVLITAFVIACVPWLAWRRTDPEKFKQKLLIPWLIMIAFGFGLFFWVLSSQRAIAAVSDPQVLKDTLHQWMGPGGQRVLVISMASLGFLAALSNAMLAYRVFRKKPLSAGAWIAHVGVGVLIIGVILSNTFERTALVTLKEGQGPIKVFGYTISFEGMTGKPLPERPLDPEYDPENRVMLRITPPGGDRIDASGNSQTFLMEPRWFVPRPSVEEEAQGNPDTMIWPSIKKYVGHDLYIALASQPGVELPYVTMLPRSVAQLGPYRIYYYKAVTRPLQYMGAIIGITDPEQPFNTPDHIVAAEPGIEFVHAPDGSLMRTPQGMPMLIKTGEALPQLTDSQGRPGVAILDSLKVGSNEARIAFSLPDLPARWTIPLSVTYKPGINLVWTGVLLAVAGILLAMVRRAREAQKIEETGFLLPVEREDEDETSGAEPKRTPPTKQGKPTRPEPVRAAARRPSRP